MDIPRKGAARGRLIRRTVIGLVLAIAIPAITIALRRLQPAAQTVERSTVWPDTVKRGEMLRQVRGLGTLVPEDILSIPATTDGRVDKKFLLPGTPVKADTILLELSNPELKAATVAAEWDVKSGMADYDDLRVRLANERLEQKAQLATTQSSYNQAKLKADRDMALYKDGLIVELNMKISKEIAEDLANRYSIDKERLEAGDESIKAQLASQQTRIEQLRAAYELKKSQVEALTVRAGTEGVLQQVMVEVGQRVTQGTPLAKVVQPWRLKAALQIQETQAKDVMIGQPVEIDTRNGVVKGKVARIDPSVLNGTRTVDATILEPLPKGAVPDLSVEGTIELERLKDVMYVGRPVFGQAQSMVTLFKLSPDGKMATRTQVKFGRTSVNTIEVLEGLRVGDQVLLSDMSAYDGQDRI
ncbi:MAG TPA: efflux RND transporter periplasmic adaptor subunit, partial [Bryobacteraceae bacterium]|nr:efflux RND transporter periplasmic adaptor subunit [Bryobacteraceae bacterium]